MEDSIQTRQVEKILVAIIVAILVIIGAILTSLAFEFGIVGNIVMGWILTTAYAIFTFFLVEPVIKINPFQFIEKPTVQIVERIVEKPIVREIQVPIENTVVEVVDRPVIQEVPVPYEVEKRVVRYIERRHKKLNIPKFKFIGSTESRSYHKRTCRFSKLIKKKYKAHSNTKAFFKRKHYHACESCIKKKHR